MNQEILKHKWKHIKTTPDFIQNPFMLIKFIAPEKTEIGAEKEILESVDLLWEDLQRRLVKKKRNKPKMTRGFVILSRGNLVSQCGLGVSPSGATGEPVRGKVKEDLA